MKILCVSDYPLEINVEKWQEGNFSDTLLYGINRFASLGVETDFLRLDRRTWLKIFSHRFFHIFMGDLDLEWRIWRSYKNYDVVYCTTMSVVKLLGLTNSLGLTKIPLVVISHSFAKASAIPTVSFWKRFYLKRIYSGFAKTISLRKDDETFLIQDLKIPKDKVCYLELGADLDFFKPSEEKGEYVVSAGRNLRDVKALVDAIKGAGIKTKIICEQQAVEGLEIKDRNIEIDASGKMSFREVREWYRKARFIVVPLLRDIRLAGLASVLDAMAMQKAVIVSRNPGIGIPIEKEGCGIVVEPGDVKELRAAVKMLWENSQKAEGMGRRGRKLAEERYNSAIFAKKVVGILKEVAAQKQFS